MKVHVLWLAVAFLLASFGLTYASSELRRANESLLVCTGMMEEASDALDRSTDTLQEVTAGWEKTIAEEESLTESLLVCADGWQVALDMVVNWNETARAAAVAQQDGRNSDDILFCLLGQVGGDPSFENCLTMLENARR
jgi:hypothetical protein